MFVRNRSPFATTLARGLISSNRGALSVAVEVVYDVGPDGSLTPSEDTARLDTDPPEVGRYVLWRGTSATAAVSVECPPRPPFARNVRFRVAERTLELSVFGDRSWERRLGQWAPSAPRPFDTMPVSWERAFGGTVHLLPHRTAQGLPHPGGPVAYPQNPVGRGLHVEGEVGAIEGSPLPNVERPGAPLASPWERTVPCGVAPCPALFALRLMGYPSAAGDADAPSADDLTRWAARRAVHHAPPDLIFDDELTEGAPLEVTGHGRAPICATVPRCPARVTARSTTRRAALAPRARSVHLDADNRRLRLTWSFGTLYPLNRVPQWLDVETS